MASKIELSEILTAYGVKRISKRRKEAIKNTLDFIEEDFQKSMRKVYRTHSSGGRKWAPNDPIYLKYHKQGGRDGNVAPGREPGERTFESKRVLAYGKNVRTKTSIDLGTNIPPHLLYSLYSKIKSKRIPVRDPFLEVFDENKKLRPEPSKRWRKNIQANLIYFLVKRRQKVRRRL